MLLELDNNNAICEELDKHEYVVVSRKTGNRHSLVGQLLTVVYETREGVIVVGN
ncbi:hypothetical protein M3204_04390 [Mesobacillus subterraneus]|uniref:hypothetical protein n=1 Tax=Mesobacillus subterraneus TaxID=285983 RepID=UPI00203DEF1D|nr:hypothetical protein [Mesobacillus subterraneus]MCM3663628.1 hypothetical protein [Mesobacillus subterraneus]MCM3683394.1 hypothetical protein [Mesobacillus subterraneus]